MADKNDIVKVIQSLVIAYPNYTPIVSGEITTVSLFLDILGEFPSDKLHQAVRKLICQEGRVFAPSIGEIRELVIALDVAEKSIYRIEPHPEYVNLMEDK